MDCVEKTDEAQAFAAVPHILLGLELPAASQIPKAKRTRIIWSRLPEHLLCASDGSKGSARVSLCQNYRVRCSHEAAKNKCNFPNDVPPERKKAEDFGVYNNRMLRSRLPHHYAHECAGVEIECKNAGSDGQRCGEKYAAKDWQEHGKTCPYRLLICGQDGVQSSGCGL